MNTYKMLLFSLFTSIATAADMPPSWWIFYEAKKPAKFLK